MFAVLHFNGSSRTNRSCYRHFYDFDAHFSAVQYSVAYFLSTFGFTKVCSDQVCNQKTITVQRDYKGTGRHFESVQVVGYINDFTRQNSKVFHFGGFAANRDVKSLKKSINVINLIRSDEGLTLETSAFESLYFGQFTLSTQLIKPNLYLVIPPTDAAPQFL